MNPVTLGEITVQGRPEFVGALRNFAKKLATVGSLSSA